MTNPFDTPDGRRAQLTVFRAIAEADDGAMADFAQEVVAGRLTPRDLLTREWAVESVMDETTAAIDAFHRLPETERAALVADGPAYLDEYIATLAAVDVEPEPSPPDDEPRPPLLRDAW